MTHLPRRHFLATTAVCLGIASALVPLVALAEGNDAEAQRLAQKRSAERYNVEVPGASLRAGGAAISVDAPLAVVRKVVTEYSKYASYIPRFQKSKVIGKKNGNSDVYLQVPILNGAATVWSLTRFTKPTKEGSGERIEGAMLEGNVNDMRAWFHLRPVDENHTILKLELLIAIKLPLPGKVVTPELEFASDQAVTAIRDRSETRHKQSGKNASAKRLPRGAVRPCLRGLSPLFQAPADPAPRRLVAPSLGGGLGLRDPTAPPRLRQRRAFPTPRRWLLGEPLRSPHRGAPPRPRSTLCPGDDRPASLEALPGLGGVLHRGAHAPGGGLSPGLQRSPGPPRADAPRRPGGPSRPR